MKNDLQLQHMSAILDLATFRKDEYFVLRTEGGSWRLTPFVSDGLNPASVIKKDHAQIMKELLCNMNV